MGDGWGAEGEALGILGKGQRLDQPWIQVPMLRAAAEGSHWPPLLSVTPATVPYERQCCKVDLT